MKIKLVASATFALCLGMSFASAADAPQMVRQQEMKKAVGAMGALGDIAKGEKPYDEASVKDALAILAAVGKSFPDHFPVGSESGMETEASPAIWQNFEDFKAKAVSLQTVAEAQLAALPADQAGVGATVGALGATCGECHKAYRLKK